MVTPVPFQKKERKSRRILPEARRVILWGDLVRESPACIGGLTTRPTPDPVKSHVHALAKNPPDPVQPGLPFGYRNRAPRRALNHNTAYSAVHAQVIIYFRIIFEVFGIPI